MPEEVDQEQGWVWYGGRLSVDFVNTRKMRFAQGNELLRRPEDLAAWLVAAEVLPDTAAAERPAVDGALLERAKELREAVDAGIRAVVVPDEGVDESALPVINSWLARAAAYPPRLEAVDGTPVLRAGTAPADAHGALCRIAADAAELLGTDARARLRICDGVNCSARFVDKSVGRRRRWCQMAVCGNRAKAAQHRRASAAG